MKTNKQTKKAYQPKSFANIKISVGKILYFSLSVAFSEKACHVELVRVWFSDIGNAH